MALRIYFIRSLFLLIVIVYIIVSLSHGDQTSLADHLKCPSQLAISVDIGRLGNKFFEYLASAVLAEANNQDLYITSAFFRIYDRYFEGITNPVVDTVKLLQECSIVDQSYEVVHFSRFYDLTIPANVSRPFVQYTGHPSHITTDVWKQIFRRRNKLIRRFHWRSEIKFAVEESINELKKSRGATTVIGIHARRTDYNRYVIPNYGSFKPAGAAYFNKAMNYFRNNYQNPVFLVISDDANWCKEQLQGNDIVYPGDGNEDDPGWDLAILSFCDHLILTYGTYGLMAAWLKGEGEVIAADNFTIHPEAKVQRIKLLDLPNWKWFSV